jgi:hypothetical protein
MEFIIAYTSFFSISVPLIVTFIGWKLNWSQFRPLCLLLIFSALADSLSIWLLRQSSNTYIILNIFLITQFSLLVWLFRRQFDERKFIDFVHGLFIIFAFVNLTMFQGLWVLNSVTNVASCLILIIVCLFYFYKLLVELPTIHIQELPMFWISFGVLIYYAGNFFLFLVNNYLNHDQNGPHRYMWILHNLLNVTKNMLFAIALWQSYRRSKSPISSSSAP